MTVADRILSNLVGTTMGRTPLEIAMSTGLNINTVRRVTRELYNAGRISRKQHDGIAPVYVSLPNQNVEVAGPSQPRDEAIGL